MSAITSFRGMSPVSQLFFSIFVVLVCFILIIIAAFIFAIPIFGIDSIMSMAGDGNFRNSENINVLKFFQVFQSIGLFIIPAMVLGYLFSGNSGKYLFLEKTFIVPAFMLVILLMFTAAPFINFMGGLNNSMSFPDWLSSLEQWMKNTEEMAAELTEAFLKVDGVSGLVFNLFMIAFLPAIGEEFFFRGVVQRIFTRMTRNHHSGIWISAILFSAIHMQFYGFLPRMLLGVLFGYLLVWSGTIWLPVVAHFFNNAFAVIAMYFIGKGMINPEIENIGSSSGSYYLAAISLGFIFLIMWQIKLQYRGREIKVEELVD